MYICSSNPHKTETKQTLINTFKSNSNYSSIMENKLQWQNATKGLYQAILINVLASIAGAVFGSFAALSEAGDTLAAFAEGTIDMGWGIWDYLELIANLAVIAAQVLFFIRLADWKNVLVGKDAEAVGKLRLAMILSVVGIVIAFIPAIGWILAILLSIAALVLQLLGYAALKNSTTLPENASKGAGKVYTSQILAIVAVVVALIPLIGGIGALVCEVIAFVMMLQGWKLIANSAE